MVVAVNVYARDGFGHAAAGHGPTLCSYRGRQQICSPTQATQAYGRRRGARRPSSDES
jgi:hypothetical protein